jgi:hypothetical protein
MTATFLPPFWALFTRLQPLGNSRRITPISWAREEALDEILIDYRLGKLPEDSKTIQKRFDSLCTNRATKYRRRLELDSAHGSNSPSSSRCSSNPGELAAVRELVWRIEKALSPQERAIFNLLAQGNSIEFVATIFGLVPSTLRSRIHRLRKCFSNG